MRLLSDSIGRKAVMAVTGLLMILFVVGHLLGNSTILFGGQNAINAYAAKLHDMAPVVWGTRVVMLVAVILHLALSIQITLENEAANPTKYAVDRSLRATFASKSMIWTGLLLGVFIVGHLIHFTIRSLPAPDLAGRPDVFGMVVEAFKKGSIAALYVMAMVALFLHLSHGAQSLFQTLGLSNDKTQPTYTLGGKVVSVLFLLGYGAIPVAILIRLIG